MEKEIELLNETEAALLRLMAQYQSGQYVTLGKCISNVRAVREKLSHLTQRAADGYRWCADCFDFTADDDYLFCSVCGSRR